MCGDSREHALHWLTRLEQAHDPRYNRTMLVTSPSLPAEITADSPCIGHCTTALGDDVCRSCLRTFEEITRWPEMSDEERMRSDAVNHRLSQSNIHLPDNSWT